MAYESLIGSWKDGDEFYDKRKQYMLQRVNDSYNERSLNSKLGLAESERQSTVDGEGLRDDRVKRGSATSLLRDFSTVTNELVTALESVAKTDTSKDIEAADRGIMKYVNPASGDSKGLKQIQSILGRFDGTSPTFTDKLEEVSYYDSEAGENSKLENVRTYDFSLTEAEKKRLKAQSTQSLLDKFFEVDTSKY